MNITKAFQTYVIAALALTLTVFTGCSTVETATGLGTGRKSAGSVQVQSVHLEPHSGGLRVSGTVGRTIGYNSSPLRHLDVEVIGADGRAITRKAVRFSPNPIRHHPRFRTSSAYAMTLPQVPRSGSVVSVAVHATSISNCSN